jgi:homoserine O-acetyltransferase
MSGHDIFHLGDVALLSGEVLLDARLAYKTYGELSPAGDNVVVMPTYYTGTHVSNEGYFGPGRAIDPARHFGRDRPTGRRLA